jgi:hypothetical protein
MFQVSLFSSALPRTCQHWPAFRQKRGSARGAEVLLWSALRDRSLKQLFKNLVKQDLKRADEQMHNIPKNLAASSKLLAPGR